ncbi:MAG: hypothetical protein AAGG48_13135 [Planctomycetota bacterium]
MCCSRFAPTRWLIGGVVVLFLLATALPTVDAQSPREDTPGVQPPDKPDTADKPDPADKPGPDKPEQKGDPNGDDVAIEGFTAEEIDDLVDQLGAREFAARERASDQLAELGLAIIPRLKKAKKSEDPEIRLRASEIIRQLTEGNTEAKIESFLAGENVNFPGWTSLRSFLGDTQGARELFIDLMTQHPKLTESLDGETRDRAVALEAVLSTVQNAMSVERRFPNKADVFALLMAGVDPNIPPNAGLESNILMVMNQSAVREIRKDWQLNRPFETLVAIWMSRSSIANRQEVLEVGMRMNLESTLDLAIRTANETNKVNLLVISLQAISRFGEQTDAPLIRELVKDVRPVTLPGFVVGDREFKREVGDIAMATIARLYKKPLAELGFQDVNLHPSIGFEIKNVGFKNQEDRDAAKKKVEEWFAETPPLVQ